MQTVGIPRNITPKIEKEYAKNEWRDIGNQEIWLPIIDFPNYECSNTGKIRSQISGELKMRENHSGYLLVNLQQDKKSKTVVSHRIIAKTFLLNPNNYPVINHKDGIKTNNNINNLEWCSYEHNNKHAFMMGLRNDMKGENNISHKLTLEKVENIRQEYLVGNISFLELSKKYNVSFLTIRRIIKNKSWYNEKYDNDEYREKIKKIIGTCRRKLMQIAKGKLTEKDAQDIRKLYLDERKTMRELGKLFNISWTIISKIIKNEIWYDEKYEVSEKRIEEIKQKNFIAKNNKIKSGDVEIIKNLYLSGYKQHEIANIFNISQTRVSQIILGKCIKMIQKV